MADPVPPHNLDAEKSVLGAILIDNTMFTAAAAAVDSRAFYRDAHRRIFEHMAALNEKSQPIDFVTLCESLTRSGELEEVGGPVYLSTLIDGVPRASNAAHYANIVADKAIERVTQADLRAIVNLVQDDGITPAVVESLTRALDRAQPRRSRDSRDLFCTAEETCRTRAEVKMLLAPYLAEGCILSVIAKIKLGKTSLVLDMLRHGRRGTGWCDFAAPVQPFRVLYGTEQVQASFAKQLQDAGFDHDDGVIVTYLAAWKGKPWSAIAPRLVEHALDHNAQVLVVDTASRWFGFKDDEENNSGGAEHVDLLLPYTAQGGTVILVRHGRKSGGNVEDAGRGSSAIEGAADAILHLTAPSGQPPDARQIDYRGRFDMPERMVVRRRNFEASPPCVIGDVEVPSARYYFERADVIQAVSNASKIRAELGRKPQTIKELSSALSLSGTTLTNELKEMRDILPVGKGGPKNNAVIYGLRTTLPSQSHRDGEVESWGRTA